jgi:ribosome-associated protein YbcJ (S4-like RNA binding protein)
MNTLLKVSVAGALALGYVSAHAAAVVPSISNPGDVFLFADVISGGSVIKAYAADTTVSINNTIGVTGTLTPGSTVYSADSNLSQLLALAVAN